MAIAATSAPAELDLPAAGALAYPASETDWQAARACYAIALIKQTGENGGLPGL